MAKTEDGKKIVRLSRIPKVVNGKKVKVSGHRRSTPANSNADIWPVAFSFLKIPYLEVRSHGYQLIITWSLWE